MNSSSLREFEMIFMKFSDKLGHSKTQIFKM